MVKLSYNFLVHFLMVFESGNEFAQNKMMLGGFVESAQPQFKSTRDLLTTYPSISSLSLQISIQLRSQQFNPAHVGERQRSGSGAAREAARGLG